MEKKPRRLLFTAWLLLAALIVFSGAMLLSGHLKLVSGAEYDIIRRYKRLDEVYNILIDGFYRELDGDQLIEGAIDGMAASVDDEYTLYYNGDEMLENQIELSREYTGVGLVLQQNARGDVEVVRVYDSTPASEAGVKAGDIIAEINGRGLSGIDAAGFESAVREIRGESGTALNMQVLRGEEVLEFTLTRREVAVSNTNSCMLDEKTGYIEIIQFGGNAVSGFREARAQLADAQSLIIDVRNNPGGLLEDVVAIADEILDGGLVVYMETRDGTRQDYYANAGAWDIPVAVLVNEMSASASEILAAAVQDNERGTVIGTQSYGKGVVQMLTTIEGDGAGLQYTFAKYFTPSGRDIHQVGVKPDIVVESGEGFIQDGNPDIANDAQIKCAMEYLSEQMEK